MFCFWAAELLIATSCVLLHRVVSWEKTVLVLHVCWGPGTDPVPHGAPQSLAMGENRVWIGPYFLNYSSESDRENALECTDSTREKYLAFPRHLSFSDLLQKLHLSFENILCASV